MASTVKETVQVASLGKWGPKVGSEYYSWSKNIKETDKGKVVPGGTYDMELYIADSGKRYINSVTVNGNVAPVKLKVNVEHPTIQETVQRAIKTTIKKSDEMSKEEWAAKDRRISRQGCIQVAVQVESDFDKAVELAEKMLSFVNS